MFEMAMGQKGGFEPENYSPRYKPLGLEVYINRFRISTTRICS